jgi:hypothetical protein
MRALVFEEVSHPFPRCEFSFHVRKYGLNVNSCGWMGPGWAG